jgi:hypothetical protein
MRQILLLVLGASALAVALLAIGRTQPAPSAPPVPVATDDHAWRAEVAAVRRDVERMKVRVERPEVVAAPASDAPRPLAPVQPHDPESERAEASERVHQLAEALDHRYTTEPVDRSWGEKQSAAIRAEIGAQVQGTTLLSASCASSLCKVVLRHDTIDAQRAAGRELAALPSLHAGVFYDYREGAAPPQTVLYVLRAGIDPRDTLAGSL